ncbi:MAG TPA: hypothetical protein VJ902_01600 [Wenzhouxiangellaceae bacterium]|nr:hypothetical protein [Wenzhouxiangellaceae bacterium]
MEGDREGRAMAESDDMPKRRHMRFEPDDVVIAQVQFIDADPDDRFFKPKLAGPVLDESYDGCALVALRHAVPDGTAEGTRCLVKLNRLGPMRGEIRWLKAIDDEVCKIGIHYLEPR